jgi:hypothetical protein
MAYDFDGTDDYMEVGSAPVTAAPLTMACWFNVDNVTVNHALISLTNGTDQQRLFLSAHGGVAGDPIRASSTAGGTTIQAATGTFTANTWHHAAGRFLSNTNRRAYFNGVGGGINTTSNIPTGINTTGIGYVYQAGARGFFTNGRIAEAAIWNIDLTDDEIAALAEGFRPSLIRPSALVFYAPLVREIADYRGGLTVTSSGPVVAEHTRRIA